MPGVLVELLVKMARSTSFALFAFWYHAGINLVFPLTWAISRAERAETWVLGGIQAYLAVANSPRL